jgi:hypothetical protein
MCLLAAVVLSGLAAACGGHHATPSTAPTVASSTTVGSSASTASTPGVRSQPPAATSGKPYWLIEDYSITSMETAGLSSALAAQYFNNPQTFLIVRAQASSVDASFPLATKVESFASFAAMQQAVSANQLLPGIKFLLYDNERWSFTPTNEQSAPYTYAAQAQQLAHAHGLSLIFTPAVNLALPAGSPAASSAANAQGAATKYNDYLSDAEPGQGAKVSDVFEIQAQQLETSPTFASFVQQAVSAAHSANPQALILVGITTSAPGVTVQPAQLMSAYTSVRSDVSGYWINIPGATPQCPTCGNARPDVGAQFLEQLAPQLGYST